MPLTISQTNPFSRFVKVVRSHPALTRGKSILYPLKVEKESVHQLVAKRLRELAIKPDAFPPQVLQKLHSLAGERVKEIRSDVAVKISELNAKAHARTAKEISRIITLKSIGQAFNSIPSNPSKNGDRPEKGDLQ